MLLTSELKRKAIHLASFSIPIAYYLSPPSWSRNWQRALLALVILSLAIEVVRLHNPRIRNVFRHFFGELLRNHEEVSLLGSTYLLIAMLLTLHLFEKPVAFLALGFLILGDTVAAIVGKWIGKVRLLGGKTLEGSAACLLVCFGLTFFMPDIPWYVGLVGALTATVFELLPIPLDDNFRIPLSAGFAMELLLR
ncbi:MAG: phosphatidate cytidylyltransferase [Candidatus Eisenbacteria bacterium]|uniref:Phosphatidate cytidylyltransferase n=1 Tax=Eiseniibacteriota bacterium TaxID=2212470 RepID=A0A538SH19_UNCEI|nr:MAG: phosphatidate cytidylyltransferase [Candidatus Eisenbacteria bacterium]TMQ56729.1 MAG: phosphatidate cytidylyltransferase [Candidatus Eisenbacteria bacterium]